MTIHIFGQYRDGERISCCGETIYDLNQLRSHNPLGKDEVTCIPCLEVLLAIREVNSEPRKERIKRRIEELKAAPPVQEKPMPENTFTPEQEAIIRKVLHQIDFRDLETRALAQSLVEGHPKPSRGRSSITGRHIDDPLLPILSLTPKEAAMALASLDRIDWGKAVDEGYTTHGRLDACYNLLKEVAGSEPIPYHLHRKPLMDKKV